MPHGGRRPGSGRKTNAQINSARDILDDTMTENQWIRLFRRLHELALDGNMRAATLLLNYRFGDPHADPEFEGPPIHIRTIEVRPSDPRPRRALDAGDDSDDDAPDDFAP